MNSLPIHVRNQSQFQKVLPHMENMPIKERT